MRKENVFFLLTILISLVSSLNASPTSGLNFSGRGKSIISLSGKGEFRISASGKENRIFHEGTGDSTISSRFGIVDKQGAGVQASMDASGSKMTFLSRLSPSEARVASKAEELSTKSWFLSGTQDPFHPSGADQIISSMEGEVSRGTFGAVLDSKAQGLITGADSAFLATSLTHRNATRGPQEHLASSMAEERAGNRTWTSEGASYGNATIQAFASPEVGSKTWAFGDHSAVTDAATNFGKMEAKQEVLISEPKPMLRAKF